MEKGIVLTNMCMLYRPDGSFLVQNRLKQDWPGLNFPGGHVKKEEDIVSSVIREMKEETGLDVKDPECVGYFEWNIPSDGVRHLAILFRSYKFEGELKDSTEGEVFFIKKEDIKKYQLSTDFEPLLDKMMKGLPF